MQISNLKSQISNAKYTQTIFRLGIFCVLAAVLVLIFPRYNNAFRYHYEVGKPWAYNTLTADFDFPIYKTDDQMAREQQQLLSTFTPCYHYIRGAQREVNVISLAEMEWLRSNNFGRIAIKKNNVSKTYPLSEVFTEKTAYERYRYECRQNRAARTLSATRFSPSRCGKNSSRPFRPLKASFRKGRRSSIAER